MVKRTVSLLAVVGGMLTCLAQKPMTSQFPLQWKTQIGVTTYRTNMLFHKGLIYIGSNGISRDNRNDKLDGVYAIDPKTGAVKATYKVPFAGDDDVTGISIADNKLFFGTDNYYFFCFDLASGQELWKYPLPYDVESTPATEDFNGDGVKDVSFSVEGYGFYALNGLDGSAIWQQDSISSHNGNVPSLLIDVNGDGVKDIVSAGRGSANSDEIDGFKMAHYGDYHFALNGKTGRLLWLRETGAGVHTAPFAFTENGQQRIVLLDCYGELQVVDLMGNLLSRTGLGYGWFSSPVMTRDQHLLVGRYSMLYNDAVLESTEEYPVPYPGEKATVKSVPMEDQTISSTTMVADVLGKGSMQGIGVTEQGLLFVMKTDGTELMKLKLPGKGAEASVYVADTDGDGKLEILVADLDGFLYCFSTNSKGKVELGGFKSN